jgi:hypothetical protein
MLAMVEPDAKDTAGPKAAPLRMEAVKARIDKAAGLADRDMEDIKVVAVSKTWSAQDITPLLEDGHRVFGENRVQEAQSKWPGLAERFPSVELHLVGALQSNKAEDAVELFDAIHSLDREKLAKALARAMETTGRRPALFVQVNTGEEPQKAGMVPKETEGFVKRCRKDYGLEIAGLMCLPPVDEPPGPHFALLDKLAGACGVSHRSMGMSGDYEQAVALGATHLRLGEAIFGPRQKTE